MLKLKLLTGIFAAIILSSSTPNRELTMESITVSPNKQKVKFIYVYDAICGWCYGFSPVIGQFAKKHQGEIEIEVISGGLKLGQNAGPIDVVAPYIKHSYTDVEQSCGVKFGDAFVNGTMKKGTMVLNSFQPAVALAIVKDKKHDSALEFASLLHKAIYVDGLEPENVYGYGKYAETIGLNAKEFCKLMEDTKYHSLANKDFQTAKKLGVDSYPTLLVIVNGKAKIVNIGFTNLETLERKVNSYLN